MHSSPALSDEEEDEQECSTRAPPTPTAIIDTFGFFSF